MSSKRLMVLMVVACSCAVLLPGCRRHGKRTGTDTDLPPEIPVEQTEKEILNKQPDAGDLGTRIDKSVANLSNVLFDYDSARINSGEIAKIEAAASFIKSHSGVSAVLEGHCDERGTAEYNMSLGERRALAVRAHLVGLGIDGSLLFTKSFGKEKPVDPGHTESAWRLNRRVEFALYQR